MKTSTVIVGDSICGGADEENAELLCGNARQEVYLRGYNTYAGHHPSVSALSLHGAGQIVSAVSGQVEVTERVISVKGQNPRYVPNVGDVVIGRVVEITGNRWLLDIHASQLAIMLLSNVTEPGGMLRRRNRGDELGMRALFDEEDLVIAEVQRVTSDGVIFLHTRAAEKYGKVRQSGYFISVPPFLMRRGKRQFVTLDEYHCQLVMGMNGSIWISPLHHSVNTDKKNDNDHDYSNKNNNNDNGVDNNNDNNNINNNEEESEESLVGVSIDNSKEQANSANDELEVRRYMVRVANCIKALASMKEAVSAATIKFVVAASLEARLNEFDITTPYAHELLKAQLRLWEQQNTR